MIFLRDGDLRVRRLGAMVGSEAEIGHASRRCRIWRGQRGIGVGSVVRLGSGIGVLPGHPVGRFGRDAKTGEDRDNGRCSRPRSWQSKPGGGVFDLNFSSFRRAAGALALSVVPVSQ